MDLTKRLVPRLVGGFGLIDKPFSAVQAHLRNRAGQSSLVVTAFEASLAEALEFLSTLSHPASRYVALPLGDRTAIVNNLRDGSEGDGRVLAVPDARTAKVFNTQADFYSKDGLSERMRYEARRFSLRDASGQDVRDVCCADDGGRWGFDTVGTPHPVEQTFDYGARVKKKRFTEDNLRTLLAAYGLPFLDAAAFIRAGRYVLLQKQFRDEGSRALIRRTTCTVEQAEDPAYGYYLRGSGYVPYIETHYESVIHDFERALKFNPVTYEPLVREALEWAYALKRSKG